MAETGNAIIIAQEIKSAEQAEIYAGEKFERLAALEKEIESSLKEIKKISGMEDFTVEKIMSMDIMKMFGLSHSMIARPIDFQLGLLNFFFGPSKSEMIKDLQRNQKQNYEGLIKISRVQVLLFEFQRVMAEILNELFEMCSSNIEVVQATINTLRMKLDKNATSMTESTKQNVRDLIKKLVSRQDTLMKQEEMKMQIKQLKDEIAELRNLIQKA